MTRDALRRFEIPPELAPKVTPRKLLLRPVDVSEGSGGFPPPRDFGKAVGTNIHVAGVSPGQWSTNLCVVVGVGAYCEDEKGWDKDNPFKVGQWVVHMGASPFFFLGQEFVCCSPDFIIAIVKQPGIPKEKLYEVWKTRGALPEGADDGNVTPIDNKKRS